jgi:hypothetical protein
MLKTVMLLVCAMVCQVALAQEPALLRAVSALDQALISRDTMQLRKLLHKKLHYGHSNAWVQSRSEVLADLFGKLQYLDIQPEKGDWIIEDRTATYRYNASIRYQLNGSPGNMKLHVLQVWTKVKNSWMLLARQSTKVPEPNAVNNK